MVSKSKTLQNFITDYDFSTGDTNLYKRVKNRQREREREMKTKNNSGQKTTCNNDLSIN